jgi:hypothetical protein
VRQASGGLGTTFFYEWAPIFGISKMACTWHAKDFDRVEKRGHTNAGIGTKTPQELFRLEGFSSNKCGSCPPSISGHAHFVGRHVIYAV